MPLPRALSIIVLVSVTLLPTMAHAADALPLPSAQLFQIVTDAVEGPVADPLWRCSPSADEVCQCVQFGGEQWDMHWLGVNHTPGMVHAEHLYLTWEDEQLWAQDFQVSFNDGEPVVTFQKVHWSSRGDPTRWLTMQTSTLRPTTPGTEIGFDEPRWWSGNYTPEFGSGCEAEVDDLGGAMEEPQGMATASATQLYTQDGDWRVDGLKMTGLLRPRLASGLDAGTQAAGLLPPTLRVVPDGARLSGEAYLGRAPVGLRAHADSSAGFGLGAGYWSSSPLCEGERCAVDSISVDGFADRRGLSAGYLVGDAGWGGPQRHVAVSTDGLNWTANEFSTREVTLLERNALFRDWSAQQVGISLNGDHHDFYLSGAHVADARGGFDLSTDQQWASDVVVGYGTVVDLGTPGTADLRIQHNEFSSADLDSGRFSRAALHLERMHGSPQRAYARPGIHAEMAMGVVDAADGALGGSRGHIDALIDGGLAFQARSDSLTHTIRPSGLLGRRIVADDALPEQLVNSGAIGATGRTADSFNFAGASVGQRFDFSPQWRLDVPFGVVFVDDGSGSDWAAVSHASIEVNAPNAHRPVVVGVDGQCGRLCDEISARGRLQVQWSERWESVTTAGWKVAEQSGMLSFDRQLRGGTQMWFDTMETGFPDHRLVHGSTLRGRWTQWRGHLRLFGDIRHPSQGGVEALLKHHWPEIGWGIGLRTAALPDRDLWAATIGLSTSPVF